MNREEITEHYHVSPFGIILTPGKFEAEMLYVPYFWELGLDGAWTEDVDGVYFFIIDADDRAKFPELGEAYGIAITANDSGFVSGTLLENEMKYAMALLDCECAESEQAEYDTEGEDN